MLKKIIAIFLCLLLALSFAACKKDKDNVDSSSNISSSDPTQDYEQDEWEEGAGLTDEEKEQIEDLWNDLQNNGGAEIQSPNSSDKEDDKTQEDDKSESSSDATSSDDEVDDEELGDSKAEIVVSVPGIL